MMAMLACSDVHDDEGEASQSDGSELGRVELNPASIEVRRARIAARAKLFGDSEVPVSLGKYAIEERIGAGAAGVVYAAKDPQLDRRVALKLLLSDNRDDVAIERMMREARAMAKLSHANVVTVYEAGHADGQHFIAMELVDAPNLRTWLADTTPSSQQIIEVFVDAGRGLAAAHTAGLVHRDFKPENVMVGDAVRVADFGLASSVSATELELASAPPSDTEDWLPTSLTVTGAVVGTPAYMAPEQFRGEDISAATDQFAYCVALFEALAGARPFTGNSLAELADSVADGDANMSQLPRDVPATVVRALERGLNPAPEQRHPSMDELLGALTPTASRPWWLLGPLAIIGIGVVAAMLWRGGSDSPSRVCQGSEARFDQVWSAPAIAKVTKAFTATGLPYAADTLRRVNTAMTAYRTNWTTMRRTTCEDTQVHKTQSPELMDLRMACLDRSLNAAADAVQLFSRADKTIVGRAVALLESVPRASRCADAAALKRGLQAQVPASAVDRVASIRKQIAGAQLRRAAGKYADAKKLAVAAVRDAESTGYKPALVEALVEMGLVLAELAETAPAQKSLQRAIDLGGPTKQTSEVATASVALVRVVGGSRAKHAEALALARAATITLGVAGANPHLRARLHRNESRVLYQMGKYADALASANKALAALSPRRQRDKRARADAVHMTAVALHALRRYDEALTRAKDVVKLRNQVLGEAHPESARALGLVGATLLAKRQFKQAQALLGRGAKAIRASLGDQHPAYAGVLTNLGNVYLELENFAAARDTFRKTLALYTKLRGPKHPIVAVSLINLGSAQYGLKQLSAAQSTYEQARAKVQQSLGVKHPYYGVILFNLGQIATDQKRFDAAAKLYAQVMALRKAAYGADHPRIADTLVELAELAIARGRRARADEHYHSALTIRRAKLGASHPSTRELLRDMAANAKARGQHGRAKRLSAEAAAAAPEKN